MTGMKEGAGEDPFADEEAEETTAPTDVSGSPEQESSAETQVATDSEENGSATGEHGGERQQMRIPYKFRRDGVQDGRSRVPLFLQKETKRAERDAQRELEDRFDGSVSLTDLREALVMTGLEHLDEVEVQLEEWGYGMTFDQ